jgi:hypothetical protein
MSEPSDAGPTLTIDLTPVESSQLSAYGYDAATQTLAIRFKGRGELPGSLYHYRNFGETDWQAFLDAPSKGSHFIRNIKPHANRYPCRRILEGPTP